MPRKLTRQAVPKAIIVMVTCPSRKTADRIAQGLVSQRLAACVNIIGGVRSLFRWQGKVESASEQLLVIKTERRLFRRLQAAIKASHPYQVPEIIALPIIAGDSDYLLWIRQSLSR